MNTSRDAAPTKRDLALRFFLIVVLGGIGIFVVTCIGDALLVYLKPRDLGQVNSMTNWVLLMLPVIVCVASAACFRRTSLWTRASLSIGATFFACVLGIGLALTLGIYFHYMIGGQI